MIPKIIIHNSISLDGSLTNFNTNMGLHYWVARKYKPDAHLIGSKTIKIGIETFTEEIPQEKDEDFTKPEREENLPYWVIPDTNGSLEGLLHTCRSFELCKDVIILVSEQTPERYINYLKERDYDYHVIGEKQIDLERAFDLLINKYNINTILTDTGRVLSNILLNQGYVSEISLLLHPDVVGNDSYNMFSNINVDLNLKLEKFEKLNDKYIWLVYSVVK